MIWVFLPYRWLIVGGVGMWLITLWLEKPLGVNYDWQNYERHSISSFDGPASEKWMRFVITATFIVLAQVI